MNPVLTVALLWLLFGGSHIALAAIRPRLVGRLGAVGFIIFFYVVAAVTFTGLVMYFAAHRFDGPAGFALADVALARWPLIGIAVVGVVLMIPALVEYPRLPTALFDQPIRSVRGIERITRHPFFAGTALFSAAHVLLAPRLIGAVFFGCWLLFTIAGAWHQDHKLRARRGRAYVEYCNGTSFLPFAAVLRGKQHIVWGELPLTSLLIGLVVALALRQWHQYLFAWGGLGIALVVTLGGAMAGTNAWRRSRRARSSGSATSQPTSRASLA